MLQQTRVDAVTPYFKRFLRLFPDVHALARADTERVLAAWSGLGYYTRARNLHRAARLIAANGQPADYESILALPGIGCYTAAAVASIVLGEPRAAVDGNVMRVVSRILNDASDIRGAETKRRFSEQAARWLDRNRPGDFNQAMMELGATICKPKRPECGACPVRRYCAANTAGTAAQLPVKLVLKSVRELELDVAIALSGRKVLLIERAGDETRMAGFRELPLKSDLAGARFALEGEFRHQIVNDRFRVRVWKASGVSRATAGEWIEIDQIREFPLTTIAAKAIRLAGLPESSMRGGR